MDAKKIERQLRQMQTLLESILSSLADDGDRSSEEREVVGTCLYCGQPIFAGEKITRGIHSNCYYEIFEAQQRGKVTFEQLEAMGRVGPPGKSGRKRKVRILDQIDLAKAAEEAKVNEVLELAKKKSRESRQSKKNAEE